MDTEETAETLLNIAGHQVIQFSPHYTVTKDYEIPGFFFTKPYWDWDWIYYSRPGKVL